MINLRPTINEFPFDKTCSDFVSLIEQRQFILPNVKICFSEYASNKYRRISSILGYDFKLWFCRKQASLGNDWNDCSAISEIVIGDTGISVYDDGSGPTMRLYVGDNINNDLWWINSGEVLPKLYKKPRKTIEYRGSCSPHGGYFHAHSNIYLVQDDDLGRCYSPEILKENQIPHHAHEWSIDKNSPTHDVPKCVLANDVFNYINEELKKRLELIRKS